MLSISSKWRLTAWLATCYLIVVSGLFVASGWYSATYVVPGKSGVGIGISWGQLAYQTSAKPWTDPREIGWHIGKQTYEPGTWWFTGVVRMTPRPRADIPIWPLLAASATLALWADRKGR